MLFKFQQEILPQRNRKYRIKTSSVCIKIKAVAYFGNLIFYFYEFQFKTFSLLVYYQRDEEMLGSKINGRENILTISHFQKLA